MLERWVRVLQTTVGVRFPAAAEHRLPGGRCHQRRKNRCEYAEEMTWQRVERRKHYSSLAEMLTVQVQTMRVCLRLILKLQASSGQRDDVRWVGAADVQSIVGGCTLQTVDILLFFCIRWSFVDHVSTETSIEIEVGHTMGIIGEAVSDLTHRET